MVESLSGTIREYAWGSHTALAELQGRPAPTTRPEAELWLGAHPSAPAMLLRPGGSVALTDVIAADASRVLGPLTVARFGSRLPFLLKVLAAEAPLSLQAHPDSAQAAAGFAAEEAAGVPRDAANRTYADASHKPELLVATSQFDALCGFREPGESADLLAALGVPALKPTVDALRAPDPATALRTAVHNLLALPARARDGLVADLARATVALAGRHPTYAMVGQLSARYPTDAGVAVATLLNWVRLQPGEAIWMPAGNLHAYLSGVGVEIMAASDNVLRGGLTPKHVDVAELLRILRFEPLRDPVVRARPVAPGVVTWPVPVEDFVLHRAILGEGDPPVRLPGTGPRVVLCLRGSLRVDDGAGSVALRGGESAFAPAGGAPVTLRGTGEAYQAGVPG